MPAGAEIIPSQPDAVNTAVGKRVATLMFYTHAWAASISEVLSQKGLRDGNQA